jgi:predicted sulfurtransferase
MMELANAAVPRITPAQAREMMSKGNTLVVDVRDAPEVEKSGKVAGAVQVSRGMLEFRADPEAPSHDKNFVKDKIETHQKAQVPEEHSCRFPCWPHDTPQAEVKS